MSAILVDAARPDPTTLLPRGLRTVLRRRNPALSRDVLVVSVRRQQVTWFRSDPKGAPYRVVRRFRASTSRFGIGQVRDTNRTPLGLHRVARKIGAGWPVGAVFRARRFLGYVWRGLPEATIAHRILWIEGLEQGFNRGGAVDTFARFIYIHGLADEPTLGRPASHGCVHLAASDLMPLFDRIREGALVWIE